MKAPAKKKRGRPRTKEVIQPPKPWTMIVRYGDVKETHSNVPGALADDDALKRYGVPAHAKAWRKRGARSFVIQHPKR